MFKGSSAFDIVIAGCLRRDQDFLLLGRPSSTMHNGWIQAWIFNSKLEELKFEDLVIGCISLGGVISYSGITTRGGVI